MTPLSFAAVSTYAFLGLYYARIETLPGEWQLGLVGLWMLLAPWVTQKAALVYLQERQIGLQSPQPRSRILAACLGASEPWFALMAVFAGILGGFPGGGEYSPQARAFGGAVAAIPVFLAGTLVSQILGEILFRNSGSVPRLKRWELLLASLLAFLPAHAGLFQGGSFDRAAAWIWLRPPVIWVGPAVEGFVSAGFFLVAIVLALTHLLFLPTVEGLAPTTARPLEPVPSPWGPEEMSPPPSLAQGRNWALVAGLSEFQARWGWQGWLGLGLGGAGLHIATLRLNRLDEILGFVEPRPELLLLLLQVASLLLIFVLAPFWVGEPRELDFSLGRETLSPNRRAGELGLVRLSALGFALLAVSAGLAKLSQLDRVFFALDLLPGILVASFWTCHSKREGIAPVLGALLYVLGVGLFFGVLLYLDGLLFWARIQAEPGVSPIWAPWVVAKALWVLMGIVFGAWLPLLQWGEGSPPNPPSS